jgi:hypothetical protein
MSRPFRKALIRYKRFRNPLSRIFGYTLDRAGARLLRSDGTFLFGSTGQPLYTSAP